jgi:hypothetical protein
MWNAIIYGTIADVPVDYGTGQPETDLVGTDVDGSVSVPFFYTLYDDTNDIFDGGSISFRTRHAGDDQGDGFKQELIIGILADGDSTIDAFVGIDKQDGAYIAAPILSSDPNDPKNTNVLNIDIDNKGSDYRTYGTDSSIYDWGKVSEYSDIDPNDIAIIDLDNQVVKNEGKKGVTREDHFLSFTVPYQVLVDTITLSTGQPVDAESTGFRFVVATSTQPNKINQDVGGLSGEGSYDIDFNDIVVIDENGNPVDPFVPTTPTGVALVPEPSSSMLLLTGALGLCGMRRRK